MKFRKAAVQKHTLLRNSFNEVKGESLSYITVLMCFGVFSKRFIRFLHCNTFFVAFVFLTLRYFWLRTLLNSKLIYNTCTITDGKNQTHLHHVAIKMTVTLPTKSTQCTVYICPIPGVVPSRRYDGPRLWDDR